jgi:hypothetical protein
MNNVIMRSQTVTTSYVPLAESETICSCTISVPLGSSVVYFEGDDGSEVPWQGGEYHRFQSIDLSEIRIKGTAGDTVTIVGGTW